VCFVFEKISKERKMKKDLKEWIVPWLYTSREYNVGILDEAMANPGTARLMLNENPIPPSEKVIEAVADSLRHGNWYPDSFLRLRTKIGKMYPLSCFRPGPSFAMPRSFKFRSGKIT
jgi:hypothetical protein